MTVRNFSLLHVGSSAISAVAAEKIFEPLN